MNAQTQDIGGVRFSATVNRGRLTINGDIDKLKRLEEALLRFDHGEVVTVIVQRRTKTIFDDPTEAA